MQQQSIVRTFKVFPEPVNPRGGGGLVRFICRRSIGYWSIETVSQWNSQLGEHHGAEVGVFVFGPSFMSNFLSFSTRAEHASYDLLESLHRLCGKSGLLFGRLLCLTDTCS